jgi:hypothetical protein
MRFWLRELAGWALVALGLLAFYQCFVFLLRRQIFEVGALTVIGIFVFRGGLHLLKVAVAARVCLRAQEQAAREAAPRPGGRDGAPSRPLPVTGRPRR